MNSRMKIGMHFHKLMKIKNSFFPFFVFSIYYIPRSKIYIIHSSFIVEEGNMQINLWENESSKNILQWIGNNI